MEVDPTREPLDVFVDAREESCRAARDAGYRRVIEMLDSGQVEWWPGYVASLRARALCGLARDGEVPVEAAIAEVDVAVSLGVPCVTLLGLAEMHSALGDWEGVLAAVRRIPKGCFRSDIRAVQRFEVWDLRARAAWKLGRDSECLRYAARIVSWMDREDPLELDWSPPWRTVESLLALSESQRRGAVRARQLLLEMSSRVDLEDWFADETVAQIEAVARSRTTTAT